MIVEVRNGGCGICGSIGRCENGVKGPSKKGTHSNNRARSKNFTAAGQRIGCLGNDRYPWSFEIRDGLHR